MADEEAVEEYRSSLGDLKMNSKPLINMLTMLAEENKQYADQFVKVIEDRALQVDYLWFFQVKVALKFISNSLALFLKT